MLTLCFSKKSSLEFYLCHVCEERCPPSTILSHLTHGDHCSNYYVCAQLFISKISKCERFGTTILFVFCKFQSYTDPNILSFSWIPNMNMRAILKPMLTKEVEKYGSGTLQVCTWSICIVKIVKVKVFFHHLSSLQVLELPENLLKKLETSTYPEGL